MASKALERYREAVIAIMADTRDILAHNLIHDELPMQTASTVARLESATLTLARELGLAAIGEDWQHAFNCGASAASRADPDHDPAEAFESQCRCGAVERNNLVATQRTTLTELTEGGK